MTKAEYEQWIDGTFASMSWEEFLIDNGSTNTPANKEKVEATILERLRPLRESGERSPERKNLRMKLRDVRGRARKV